MASVNIGDRVRFLNSVGGGRVVRIEGQLAYVDDDGFETPVMIRECVVVARAGEEPTKTTFRPVAPPPTTPVAPQPTPTPQPVTPQKIEETDYGDKLNVVLAFEPVDIKRLSETTFDAYLVNDSNYFLGYAVLTRREDSDPWSLLAAGSLEPNIQEYLGEISRDKLPDLANVCVQFISWKNDRPFQIKRPVSVINRLDVTKFFKLHCFRENIYFDSQVIAVDIVKDDRVIDPAAEARHAAREERREKEAALANKMERRAKRPVKRVQPKPGAPNVRENNGVLEVDLHIEELVDNTRGMSNADILNMQVDEFRRVMDENAKMKGRKIVFIHGKGEGVLRQALMKELTHRYKGNDVQDASFQQYGFGATQVTIR